MEADEPAWEASYNRIRKDFELDLNGTPVAEFLLVRCLRPLTVRLPGLTVVTRS